MPKSIRKLPELLKQAPDTKHVPSRKLTPKRLCGDNIGVCNTWMCVCVYICTPARMAPRKGHAKITVFVKGLTGHVICGESTGNVPKTSCLEDIKVHMQICRRLTAISNLYYGYCCCCYCYIGFCKQQGLLIAIRAATEQRQTVPRLLLQPTRAFPKWLPFGIWRGAPVFGNSDIPGL